MKLKEVGSYWTKRKRDFRRLFRSLSDFEKQHFSVRRRKLQKQEAEMVKIKAPIRADKVLFQKITRMGQGAKGLWQQLRYSEARLEKIRDGIAKKNVRLGKRQMEYRRDLKDYQGMVRVVTSKVRYQNHPEFSVTFAQQPEVKAVYRDRRRPEKGLEMD